MGAELCKRCTHSEQRHIWWSEACGVENCDCRGYVGGGKDE